MPIYKNFKLSALSFYKTGGLCKTFYQPESKKELGEALLAIKEAKENYFILGAGSNSLISDENWGGSVINLNKMNHIDKKDSKTLLCEAGASNSDVADFALSEKLGGASWLYGLPGSLGATTRMNARCYGGEISQIVTKVTSFTPFGEEKIYRTDKDSKNLFEGYKKTLFMKNKEIIAELEISLFPSEPLSIKEKMISCFEDRKKKGQYLSPSCGCVFKNDYRKEVSVPSGLLIDFCGLKGQKNGRAMVSHEHANFILNKDSATSSDILELSFLVREKVWEKLGVWLEYEMEFLGSLSPDLEKKLKEKRAENFNYEDLEKLRKSFHS